MKAKPSPASAGAALPCRRQAGPRAALRNLARTGPLLALLAAACFAGGASSAAPIHAPALDLRRDAHALGPLFRFCLLSSPEGTGAAAQGLRLYRQKFVGSRTAHTWIAIFDGQALTDNGLDPAALRCDPARLSRAVRRGLGNWRCRDRRRLHRFGRQEPGGMQGQAMRGITVRQAGAQPLTTAPGAGLPAGHATSASPERCRQRPPGASGARSRDPATDGAGARSPSSTGNPPAERRARSRLRGRRRAPCFAALRFAPRTRAQPRRARNEAPPPRPRRAPRRRLRSAGIRAGAQRLARSAATSRLDLNQELRLQLRPTPRAMDETIAIAQDTASFAGLFPASARAMLEADPRGFWTDDTVRGSKSRPAGRHPGDRDPPAPNRPIPPAPGAEACLRSSFDAQAGEGSRARSMASTALYDPATDRVGTFCGLHRLSRPGCSARPDRRGRGRSSVSRASRFADAAPAEPK